MLAIVVKTSAQNAIGIGTGFDWVNGYDTYPSYSEKDINLSFSHTRKNEIFEVRQGLRYEEFVGVLRSSTYVLAGLTTLRDRAFVFDGEFGLVFNYFARNRSKYNPYFQYPSQLNLAAKMSFSLRLSKEKRLYLGLDWLLSPYKYFEPDHAGEPVLVRWITGSVLLSLTYVLPEKVAREKKLN